MTFCNDSSVIFCQVLQWHFLCPRTSMLKLNVSLQIIKDFLREVRNMTFWGPFQFLKFCDSVWFWEIFAKLITIHSVSQIQNNKTFSLVCLLESQQNVAHCWKQWNKIFVLCLASLLQMDGKHNAIFTLALAHLFLSGHPYLQNLAFSCNY